MSARTLSLNAIANKVIVISFSLLLWCALALILPTASAAESISVVYSVDSIPFQYQDADGQPAGLIIDFWERWSKKNGVDVSFVPATWDETLKLVKDKKVDAHAGLFYSKERDSFLDYGKALAKTDTHIFYHESLPQLVAGRELLPYRVGVIAGDLVEGYLRKHVPNIFITPYPDYDAMMADLNDGQLKTFAADTPTALYYLNQYGLASKFQFHVNRPLYQSEWLIAVPEGMNGTLHKINKGIEAISLQERNAIVRNWSQLGTKRDADTLVIAIDRGYRPLYYIGVDGQAKGLAVDIWRLWAEKTGRKIDFRPSNWTETIEAVKTGQADIHGGLFRNDERNLFMDFGEPFYQLSTGLFFKKDKPYDNLNKLVGKRVGVVKGTLQESFLRSSYPALEILPFSEAEENVLRLLKGDVDAIVEELATVEALTDKLGLRGVLARSSEILMTNRFRPAVGKGNKELLHEVNSGLERISEAEFAKLEERWIFNPANRQYLELGSSVLADLNEEEIAWINENPTVTVGVMNAWPPVSWVDQGGKLEGLDKDIARLLSERVGLKFELIPRAFNENMEAVRSLEIDVIMDVSPRKDREEFLNFTSNYLHIPHVIVGRVDGAKFKNEEALRGKIVALERGFGNNKYFKTRYPEVTILEQPDTAACLEAVANGQADAYAGNRAVALHVISQRLLGNLQIQGILGTKGSILALGVRKDAPILASILNKGLATINLKDRSRILSKFIAHEGDSPSRKKVALSIEERSWLKSHPNIRLGIDTAWPPFEFFKDGIHSGLSAKYVERLEEEVGLSFAFPAQLEWAKVMELAQQKELDVFPTLAKTQDRENFLSFSKPYASFPYVIYQRTDDIPASSLAILEGRSVGVVKGYAIAELLRDNHSGIELKEYGTLSEALDALSRGKIMAVAGNLVVIEALRQELSIYNIAPTVKMPYTQELRFGVRKDWPELVNIINKWLDKLTSEQRKEMERSVGIDAEGPFVPESTESPVDIMQLALLGGGILAVFAVSLFLLLFIRRALRSRVETLYSSHQYKVAAIVVGLLFLCLVVVATWYTLHQVENRARYSISQALESVLISTHEALSIWEKQHVQSVNELVEDPVLRGLTIGLLQLPAEKAIIEGSPQLWNVRKLLQKLQKSRRFVDYAIVSKDKINYAAQHDHDLIDKSSISIQRPRMLDRVFAGNSVFIPPIKTHEKADEKDVNVVCIAAPIKSSDGKTIAALVLYYDVTKDFQRIISMGRIAHTGETYAVDKNGGLVSLSRFDEKLQGLGLLQEGQEAILNLRIADPGGDLEQGHVLDEEVVLPLTYSASSVIQHRSGLNVDGYRDYRGVMVFGAWLWDNELGLGLITEIDEEEALGSYRSVRNTVIVVIFITILLGCLMTGLSNWIGQSAARSLSKAKEELEDRVEERTAELKKISVAVEQSPSTVVITDTMGTIEYVNPMFTEMTGYTAEEAVGLNPRVLKSGEHSREFYEELWETIAAGNVWTGDFHNRRKNGDLFWERAHIAPITDDNNVITHYVAVKEDITERKAQEERFQALLDAAPDAMVIVNQNGSIALVNIATEELFEYTREEMLGQKVEMLLPDSIREEHPGHRDKFFARPGDLSLVENKNFVGQTQSGIQVPVDISLSPFETQDGLQVIASIRDVTERKKAEAELKASEERTRLILASAGEGVFGVNLEGKVSFINEAACSMLGYRKSEIMDKAVHELIHHTRPDGSFYPVEECPMRHAFTEGISSRVDDEVLWRKDGTSFMVEYAAVPMLREGQKIGAVINFSDITERKEMELALIEAKDKAEVLSRDFSNFLESTSDLVYLKDPKLRYLACSKPLAEMLGYDDWRDVVGHTDSEISNAKTIIHFTPEPELEVIEKGEVLSLEENIIKLDDHMGWASTIKKPLLDSHGEVVGILSISRDITQMVEMTRALESSKAETDDALALVTSSIQYASRIQRSVLPPDSRLRDLTVDHFVVWEPRDVVGGDLYWCDLWGEGSVIVLGDCTGHGVPGAFMTLLSTGALKRGLAKIPEGDSAGLIAAMHQSIQMQLGQHRDNNGNGASDDGLELGICYLAPDNNTITYAGARMPLFIDDGQSIDVVKADKKGIGYRGIPLDFEYTNHIIELKSVQNIFMTTDGLIDQIGGEKRRGFGKKRFIALLESLRSTPMANQGDKIYSQLLMYQGKEKRRDDVSIIGFTI